MIYQTALLTHPGGRAINEDFCAWSERDGPCYCWVVADGLGGHGGGAVASKLAVEAILSVFAQTSSVSDETLLAQFNAAQNAVLLAQKESLQVSQMQTTAVALLIEQDTARWGHIGDTRLYYFHAGQLHLQTRDHSVPQMLVQAGEIESSAIRFHEDRNRLLRSIGTEETFKPRLETQPIPLQPGDAFLLCSDGFWEYVLETEMMADLTAAANAQAWLDAMEQRLLTKVPAGHDNYSAIAIILQTPNTL